MRERMWVVWVKREEGRSIFLLLQLFEGKERDTEDGICAGNMMKVRPVVDTLCPHKHIVQLDANSVKEEKHLRAIPTSGGPSF